VGLVILTNADPGWLLRDRIRRKLLELLFDGRPEAEALLNADAKSFYADLAAERKLMTIPAEANESAKLAKHYANDRSEKSPSARPQLLQSLISASGKARSPAARTPMAQFPSSPLYRVSWVLSSWSARKPGER
jgi:hypothetical protein